MASIISSYDADKLFYRAQDWIHIKKHEQKGEKCECRGPAFPCNPEHPITVMATLGTACDNIIEAIKAAVGNEEAKSYVLSLLDLYCHCKTHRDTVNRMVLQESLL